MSTLPLRARLFYLIRAHDVELAEDFARRCPEVEDLVELNTFFHQILSQYDDNTQSLRQELDDTSDLTRWIQRFETHILPYLRRHRFPPLTGKEVVDIYYSPGEDAVKKVG